MDKQRVDTEIQLLILQGQCGYYEGELKETRNKLIEAKTSIDRLLDEISDMEQKLRISAQENIQLRRALHGVGGAELDTRDV